MLSAVPGYGPRKDFLTRLTSTLPVRKLAALLSLLMILLGGPAGGAFALCLGGNGHLAIEALEVGGHDCGAALRIAAADHLTVSANCVDIPLVQASPLIVKKQLLTDLDAVLLVSAPAWSERPATTSARIALPAEEPPLDPRLVSHRTVVLLN